MLQCIISSARNAIKYKFSQKYCLFIGSGSELRLGLFSAPVGIGPFSPVHAYEMLLSSRYFFFNHILSSMYMKYQNSVKLNLSIK